MPESPSRKPPLPAGLIPAALAATLLLAGAAYLGLKALRSRPAPRPLASRRTIAVVPFRNLGGPETGYFPEGMGEEFSRLLKGFRGVSVLAPAALARYRDRQRDAREIGRPLGADLVVSGGAGRSAGRFRMDLELLDAATGARLWSGNYDRPFAEIFEVQAQAALEVARTLALPLTPSEQAAARRRITASADAYDRYLQGRAAFSRSHRVQSYQEGIEMLRQAVEIDPGFALAHASLGRLLAHWHREIRADPERLEEAESAARRALQADPDLADGRLALALVRACQGRWNEALELARHCLERRPDDVWIHVYLSWIYTYRLPPDPDLVLEHAEEAVRLAPELGPAYCQLARGLAFAGRYTEAEAALRRALELMPESFLPHLGFAEFFAGRGRLDQAREEIGFALSFAPEGPEPLFYLACIEAAQGEIEEALAAWERAVQRGFHDWDLARRLPCLDALREQERFVKLLPVGDAPGR